MTSPSRPRAWTIAWAFYLGLAVAGVLWIGAREGTVPLSRFLIPAQLPLDLAVGLGTGALLAGGWALARRNLATASAAERKLAGVLGPLTGEEAAALAAVSGFAEELFFRGAMQSAWGPVAATLVFAVLHSGPGRELRLWSLFAALAGAALALITLWRGTLLPAIAAHVLVNTIGLRRLARVAAGEGSSDPS